MKIKIIGEGGHRVYDNMLIFNTENGQIEMDAESAKEITLTLLDSLYCTDAEMCEVADLIDDKIIERDEKNV